MRFLAALVATAFAVPALLAPACSTREEKTHLRLDQVVQPVTVSTEIAISDPMIDPMAGQGIIGGPNVAWNGNEYLVVWTNQVGASYAMHAARMDSTGRLLDPVGLTFPSSGTQPVVSSDGSSFLVVWTQGGDVLGARVAADDTILDAVPITISAQSTNEKSPAVAYDGTNYLVVWADGGIYGSRVSKAGIVLDPARIALSPSGSDPRVACDGSGCFAAWNAGGVVHGVRVGSNGKVLDSSDIVLTGVFALPTFGLTYDGGAYFAVGLCCGGNPIVGRVGTDGAVLGISQLANGPAKWYPVVASDGSDTLVVAVGGNAGDVIVGSRVSKMLIPLDLDFYISQTPLFNYQVSFPALGYGSGQYLVAWTTTPQQNLLSASRVGADGTLLDSSDILVSAATHAQTLTAIGSDGKGYLAVFTDTGGAMSDLRAVRVDAAGTPLDKPAFTISAAPHWQYDPAVAYDGTSYVVAWHDGRDVDAKGIPRSAIYAARVSAAGVVLDPSGVVVAGASAAKPGIACGQAECLLVWTDSRASASDTDIYAARLDKSGVVLDATGIAVSKATGAEGAPRVAWDGTNYLVVWQGQGAATTDIYAARVAASGSVIDTTAVLVSVDGKGVAESTPSVAFLGGRYLVGWEREGDIYGVRLGTDAKRLDAASFAISKAAGAQRRPAVVDSGDGHNFFVAWEDHRGATDDIYAAFVSNEGEVLETLGVGVVTNLDERAPALASRGGGHVLVGHHGFHALSAQVRIGAHLIDSDALDGTPCTKPEQCASRQCIEGLCCNRACDSACETCAATASPGICACTGLATCASNTACKKKVGLSCTASTDCDTTFCADGVCCSTACAGECNVCNDTPGTCTVIAKGETGADPACRPGYFCNGIDGKCPTTCAADTECAPGYYCSPNASCTVFCAGDADCPANSRCNAKSGKCVAGATCDGDHTLTLFDGAQQDCSPYLCTLAGACLQKCGTSVDCLAGYQCDDKGACSVAVLPVSQSAPEAAGCSCRTSGMSGGTTPLSLAALAAWAAARARRRRVSGRRVPILAAGILCAAGLLRCRDDSGIGPQTGGGIDAGTDVPLVPGPGSFATPCTMGTDCASGLCASGRCTTPCIAASQCPPGPEWSCIFSPGTETTCQCAPSGPEQCDGRDNDCNGTVDDRALCPPQEVCDQGACVCPGDHRCGTRCVDKDTDPTSCGACNTVCPAGAACKGGTCACASGWTVCGGVCVDASVDPKHCGACATECSPLEICAGGKCSCADRVCGQKCVDSDNDPVHCGACGHDCLGGACVAGACRPIALAKGFANSIALDSTNIYWTDGVGVSKMPLGGGNRTALYVSLSGDTTGVAIDAATVYWVMTLPSPGGRVMSVPIGGGMPTVIAGGLSQPYHLAIDATDVYWATISGSPAVMKAPKGGGLPVVIASTTAAPTGLAIDSTNVYFTTGAQGTVVKAPLAVGPSTVIAQNLGPVSGVAVDATDLYWSSDAGLMKMPLEGGLPAVIGPSSVGTPLLDGSDIYVASPFGGLFKTTKSGASPKFVVSETVIGCFNGMGVAADALYFGSCTLPYGLMMLAK